jgi:hypothetical protein
MLALKSGELVAVQGIVDRFVQLIAQFLFPILRSYLEFIQHWLPPFPD